MPSYKLACLALLLFTLNLASVSGAAAAEGKPKPPPPCSSPEHRQFDFWIGDWSVTTPDGKFAGTNLITRPLGQCVIQEHWVGSQGGKGESYNAYDATRGVWHQTWVDDSGTVLLLDGGLVEGKMVLSGTQGRPDKLVHNRITWTPVDSAQVQQLWESSTDGGKTWSPLFLGIYRPRQK